MSFPLARSPILLLAIIGALTPGSIAAPQGATSANEVKNIAGDGKLGMTDGLATAARFLAPTGLTRAANGTVYISDEAGQRIRALGADGIVRTIAGSGQLGDSGFSVLGGYRDGPALQAQFNHPSGLAIGPSGALYIADSKNACIRRLENGIVTTVVGKPGQSASVDGPVATARLLSPRSLAFDKEGRLWIGDFGAGLRLLNADQTLSTIALHSTSDRDVESISISPDVDDPTVIAATPRMVIAYHISGGTDQSFGIESGTEGDRPFGHPAQVVALGHRQVLFTDMVANNIRYLRLPTPPFINSILSRRIAGGAFEDGTDNAGFTDGARDAARFYQPSGAVLEGNVLWVADAGNHRIRRILLPQFRVPEMGLDDEYRYDSNHFEIAYVGPSVTFWDTYGGDSICATLEQTLNGSGRFRRPVRCHTIRMDGPTIAQIQDYIRSYLSFRKIDLIVIPIDPGSAAGDGSQQDVANFQASMKDLLASLKPTTRVMLLWQYNYFTFSDDENLAQGEVNSQFRSFPDENYATVSFLQTLEPKFDQDLPIFQYDTYRDFARYEKTVGHHPLYGGLGTHTNPRGNEFMAGILSSYLLKTLTPITGQIGS